MFILGPWTAGGELREPDRGQDPRGRILLKPWYYIEHQQGQSVHLSMQL